MANGLYDKARESFLDGTLSWTTGTINAALIDTGTYSVNLATHDFFDDVSGVVGTPTAITGRTATAGVADGDDVTFTAVSGTTVEAIIIYKVGGGAGSSPLIAYIDTGTGLPVTPNGGDLIVVWSSGANKIFKL